MSNRSAFYVEYVSIPLCRSAFGYRSYLKCFNVTTANYPPRKTSSRSAFNVEQVSILCRIREHSIAQVSIRIPIISLCRSAFDHTSSVSMLLPPITLLGKHQAGQHLTSNRSAFHIPLRQRFAVQMQRSIRSLSLSLSPLSLSLIIIYMHICAWQSADSRVTSDHCRVTIQRLFSKKFLIAWNVQKTLFDSRPMVAWLPITVAWPFSDFFQNFPKLLETSKNVVGQSADGRVTSTTVAWPFSDFFSKKFLIAWNVQKTLFGSRPTVAWPPTTVAWPFSDFFSKKFLIAWNVEKSLFDSRPMVAWPPTTLARHHILPRRCISRCYSFWFDLCSITAFKACRP